MMKKRKLTIHTFFSKNARGDNKKFKPDMIGIGIIWYSIFNDNSDFDLYIQLLIFTINIRWERKDKIKINKKTNLDRLAREEQK